MFETLVRAVEKARENAAFFRKADLHVHSYESHDFPQRSQKDCAATDLSADDYVETPRDFLRRARLPERGLDIVAITDHNKCRTACEISRLAPKGALVLPGMEISIQCDEIAPDSIHLVAIFPTGTAPEDIERIFLDSGMPAYESRDVNAKVTKLRLTNLVKRIHETGGLCVAAHVNLEGGTEALPSSWTIQPLD